jgi:hypothetical protein
MISGVVIIGMVANALLFDRGSSHIVLPEAGFIMPSITHTCQNHQCHQYSSFAFIPLPVPDKS